MLHSRKLFAKRLILMALHQLRDQRECMFLVLFSFVLWGGVDPVMYNYVSPGHTGDVYQHLPDTQQHPQQQVTMGLPINPNNPYQYHSHVSTAVFNLLMPSGNKMFYVLNQACT